MQNRLAAALLIMFSFSSARALAGSDERPDAQVPTAPAGGLLRLSLRQAVEIALGPDGSTRVQLARALVRQSEARAGQARAALVPNLDSSVAFQDRTANLRAFGIAPAIPIPGFVFPTFVGPFSVFDARATASQSLFDWSAIRRYQASRAGVTQAQAERESAEDQARSQVARAYLAALRGESVVQAERANLELAERLLRLAADQKSAGTGTGIEVTRARVQLSNQKQRLLVAENEREKAHLQLLRAMGLDLAVRLELTDPMAPLPVAPVSPAEALQVALASRPDWSAQMKREEAARLNRESVRAERIPSLSAFGDYGSIGASPGNSLPTRSIGVSLRIPIYDGGRRDARRAESLSLWEQEKARTRDLRAQIELEVRLALDALRSADDQVKVAEEGLALAEGELAQAQRRYQAGMAPGLEITDAQTRLERARENRIAAIFNANLARIDLAGATGTLRQAIR